MALFCVAILTRRRKRNDLDVTDDGKDSSGRGQQVFEDGMQAGPDRSRVRCRRGQRWGREALRRVREDKPDLIILDKLLPRLGGEHVLQVLQQEDSLPSGIVLSGLSQKRWQTEKSRCIGVHREIKTRPYRWR